MSALRSKTLPTHCKAARSTAKQLLYTLCSLGSIKRTSLGPSEDGTEVNLQNDPTFLEAINGRPSSFKHQEKSSTSMRLSNRFSPPGLQITLGEPTAQLLVYSLHLTHPTLCIIRSVVGGLVQGIVPHAASFDASKLMKSARIA